MRLVSVKYLLQFIIVFILCHQAWAANTLNSDLRFDTTVAVTVNGNDNIAGKFEYADDMMQLITFNNIGGTIYSEPYVFKIIERSIISKDKHRIKCKSINDRYGSSEIVGTIDFSNKLKPKVHLVNDFGEIYISNISNRGKKMHDKYIPNVRLGE